MMRGVGDALRPYDERRAAAGTPAGHPHSDQANGLRREIKKAIVRSLKLGLTPEEIDDDIQLFGEGLGLDSIDALELVLELERTFGVAVTDEQVGQRVLRSVSSIADFIEGSRRA
jgi:acyl carrier protein